MRIHLAKKNSISESIFQNTNPFDNLKMKHISIRQLFLFLLFIAFFFYSPTLVKGQATNEDVAKNTG